MGGKDQCSNSNKVFSKFQRAFTRYTGSKSLDPPVSSHQAQTNLQTLIKLT